MDRIRLKSSADDAYKGRCHITGKLTSASSLVYYPGQVVEARYRGSYRYLPATILSVKTNGSGSRYDIEFEDGTVIENITLPISVNFFWPDAAI